MAVSKMWSLYQTIGKAVKYICNYKKTNDGTLIYSHKCTERFADHEFRDVLSKARNVKKPRIGYHMMVSFSPEDDVSPEKALEIGREIVEQYTERKYQYVLAVHTDQKHIHVHCIMNSVDFKDYKKLQIKDKDLNKLEKINDKICKENGLSVIENKSGEKGKKSYEYDKYKNSVSWKDKLKEAIDRSILEAESYEDFLNRMQLEEGYEITRNTEKSLSFKLSSGGQVQATRTRKLGEEYSVDGIKERIKNKKADDVQKKTNEDKSNKIPEQLHLGNETISYGGTIKKIIDVAHNEKAKNSAAYLKKLNMINIETYAGMMKFVKEYQLFREEDIKKAQEELDEKNNLLTAEIREVYSELNLLEADTKQFEKYLTNFENHKKYISTVDKDEKYNLSEANKKFESALYYFKKNNINPKEVTSNSHKQQLEKIHELKLKLEELKKSRKSVRGDIKQLDTIRNNNQQIFGNGGYKDNTNTKQNDNRIK